MLILGLLLLLAGIGAILAALTTASGSAELLGADINAVALFLIGVASGLAILWGFSMMKFGTRRSLRHRRESRRLSKLSQKLERVEAERRQDDDSDGPSGRHVDGDDRTS